MAEIGRISATSSRVVGGSASTGSIIGAGQADVIVTLDSAMPDTNYRVAPSVTIDEDGESLRVRRVRSKTTTQVVVNVVNNAITSKTGTVEVLAVPA